MLVCVYLVSQEIVSFTGENSALSSPKLLFQISHLHISDMKNDTF